MQINRILPSNKAMLWQKSNGQVLGGVLSRRCTASGNEVRTYRPGSGRACNSKKNSFTYPAPLHESEGKRPWLVQIAGKSPRHNASTTTSPPPTEQLSPDNPVHQRKRFSSHKSLKNSVPVEDSSATLADNSSSAERNSTAVVEGASSGEPRSRYKHYHKSAQRTTTAQ